VLVELVGRAGAGKSTIHRALLERYRDLEPMPLLRKRPYTGVLARHTLAALGTLARRRALDPRFPVDQVRMMAYLRALPVVFAAGGRRRVVLFDQGPLFSLTRPYLADARLAAWWESTFALWRERLDLVVSLDAPDDVLLERIKARPKFHRVQDREKQDALEFLANTRSVYDDALARLGGHERAPIVLRIDTGRSSVDAAADRIRSCIDEILTAGGGRDTHGPRLPVASV
jgi:thymidylate kinase